MVTALSARRWWVERALSGADDLVLSARIERLAWCRRVDPSYGKAALTHGLALLTDGQFVAARAHLRASQLRLHNAGTELALGNSWLQDGQPRRATEAYRRALKWQPASFRANLSMASAQHALGARPGGAAIPGARQRTAAESR